MDFFGFLLTVLVFTVIFKESTKTPEKLTTSVSEFEYAEPQYVSDFSFSPVPSASLSEDNTKLQYETEYKPSDYDEYYVTEDHNQLDSTLTVPTEIQYLYQDDEDIAVTTQQVELDATPTMQVDEDTTVVNDTSITQAEQIPFFAATTMLKLATVMLIVICAAFFITTMLIIWNNGFISFSMKYKMMYEINSNDAELGNVKHQDTFKI